MDESLSDLLRLWFSVGNLELKQISWQQSTAECLEKVCISMNSYVKIALYEAVHKMADWRELKQRLSNGRRCLGFFHKSLPNEPLAFIHVGFHLLAHQ